MFYIAEEVPANYIVIQLVETTKIEIIWAMVDDTAVTGYLYSLDPPHGGNPPKDRPGYIAQDTTKTSLRHSFDGLVAGAMYTITLQISGPDTVLEATQRTSK
jgi:hypothetical protein